MKFKCTGRELDANGGIIGICEDLDVSEGYDSSIYTEKPDWIEAEDYNGLTTAEQIELADVMIDRWQRFKGRAENA